MGKIQISQNLNEVSPSSDWFNNFTNVLVNDLGGLFKSVEDVLAGGETLEELDSVLSAFFERCKEHRVKMSTKMYKTGEVIKFSRQKINTKSDSVKIEIDDNKLK